MSESLKLESNWPEVREKLKETNIDLTDEDLEYEQGKEDELLKRLSGRLGKPVEEVKEWIESVSSNKTKAG